MCDYVNLNYGPVIKLIDFLWNYSTQIRKKGKKSNQLNFREIIGSNRRIKYTIYIKKNELKSEVVLNFWKSWAYMMSAAQSDVWTQTVQ